jgi:hypothetical protein
MDNKSSKPAELSINDPSVEGWKPTHAEVVAWNERNGGWFQGRIDEARCAIDDARSMHLLSAAPTPPSAPVQQSVREALQLLHEHAQLYLPNYNDRQNVYDTVTSALSTSPLLDKNDQAEGEALEKNMEQEISVEPDAWETKDMCVGPNYGKTRYDKLPIQSLNQLQYTHEKLYLEKTVIGLMKSAYYDGYTDKEQELRDMPQPDSDELVEALKLAKDTINVLWVSHHANRADAAISAIDAALAQSPSVGQKGEE